MSLVITSGAVTSSTCSRMSTIRTVSTNGIVMRSPGFTVERYFPTRSTTPRSNGRTTRTPLTAHTTSSTATAMPTITSAIEVAPSACLSGPGAHHSADVPGWSMNEGDHSPAVNAQRSDLSGAPRAADGANGVQRPIATVFSTDDAGSTTPRAGR